MRLCCSFIIILLIFHSCNVSNEKNKENISDSVSIESLSKQIRKNPFNAKLFAERAKLYWNIFKKDSAINDAIIATKIDSTNEEYSLLLAEYLLRITKSDTDVTVLKNFLKRRPESVKVLSKIAKYYSYLKDYKNAKIYIDNALTIEPQHAEAHFVKGMVLYETNQFKEAIKAFQDVIQYNPEESEAYMMLGLIYQEMNDTIAIQYYKTAAQLKGKDPTL